MSEPEPNEIADLLAPFWSERHVREVLGLDEATLAAERAAGWILGVEPVGGGVHYPVDQFERTQEGEVRVKPALREFFEVLADRDPWTVGILLHTPADELDGLNALDFVRGKGDQERLLRFAHHVNAEFDRH